MAELGEITVHDLLNKKSKTYKELGKELDGSNELAVAGFLSTNPKSMVRPLLAGINELIIGFED